MSPCLFGPRYSMPCWGMCHPSSRLPQHTISTAHIAVKYHLRYNLRGFGYSRNPAPRSFIELPKTDVIFRSQSQASYTCRICLFVWLPHDKWPSSLTDRLCQPAFFCFLHPALVSQITGFARFLSVITDTPYCRMKRAQQCGKTRVFHSA